MRKWIAEFIGTFALVFAGTGAIVINDISHGAITHVGIALTFGLIVLAMIYTVGDISGAHLNPAVTIALASIGAFDWAKVPMYIVAQIAGGFLGGVIVWLAYLPHWKATPDPVSKLAVFSTTPAIRQPAANFASEFIGGFALVLALLAVLSPGNLVPGSDLAKGFGPVLVGVIVMAIGLSLGGPTGYAINPARDLGPRIAHAVLPIYGKGSSDWSYAWIPIVAPTVGGVLGGLVYHFIWK